MNRTLLRDKKFLAMVFIVVGVTGFVAGTVFTYQVNQINARDGIAYKNPVILDLYKNSADPQLVAKGWTYLGQAADERYHYQWIGHNHIMNAGQNWQNSLLFKASGAGQAMYIGLSTGTYGSQTDASLQGGEAPSGLVAVSAQNIGVVAATAGTATIVLTNVFTYTGAGITGVDLAGLFANTAGRAANAPTLWAETTFAAVKLMSEQLMGRILASGDTLTIVGSSPTVSTWTITSGGA